MSLSYKEFKKLYNIYRNQRHLDRCMWSIPYKDIDSEKHNEALLAARAGAIGTKKDSLEYHMYQVAIKISFPGPRGKLPS